jgi:acetyl esterase/lipase
MSRDTNIRKLLITVDYDEGKNDPLRDRDETFYALMSDAGVKATSIGVNGMSHCFL